MEPSSRGQSRLNKSVPWKKVSQMQMLYRGNSIQGGNRYYKKCSMDRCHFDEGNRYKGSTKGPPLRGNPRENKKCSLTKGVYSEKVTDTNFIEGHLSVLKKNLTSYDGAKRDSSVI